MKAIFYSVLLSFIFMAPPGARAGADARPIPISADWNLYPGKQMHEIWNYAKNNRGTMFDVKKLDLPSGEHALVYHFQILDRRVQFWRCEERFSAEMDPLGSRCFRMREIYRD